MQGRWAALVLVAVFGVASADGKKPADNGGSAVDAKDPEPTAEEPARELPHLTGPKLVDLGNNAEIDLPAGMTLFERAAARKMLEEEGDDSENVVALVGKDDASWMVVIEYADIGYVSDSDADELKSDDLLESYKQGTLAQNAKRRRLGVQELFVDTWGEAPRYDRATRRLVWGINAHTSDNTKIINFMTRILGRNGFLSVNLIDAPDRIEASKKEALAILSATGFRAGFRHTDHQDSDRDSGVGLTGLILGGGGVAFAAKTGLLVKILLVLKKGFLFIVLGIGGFVKWLFGRRKRAVTVAEAPVTDSSDNTSAAVVAAPVASTSPPPDPPPSPTAE